MSNSKQVTFVFIFILIFSFALMVLALDTYPRIWFDEGYKANAAYTMAERHVYGTYTADGFIPFDPGISSGPVDVLAAAISFELFGVGVTQARLTSVCFTLIAVFSLYQIAAYLYGTRGGLFIILFILAFPAIGDTGLLLIGRQFLGEPAALALISLGLWLWFRSWENGRWMLSTVAGVSIGLGLLSKLQVGIALLPAITLICLARFWFLKPRTLREFIILVGTLGMILLWTGLGRLMTPPDIAQQNSKMLMDAIQTNLITGLWGQQLTHTALMVIGVLDVGVVIVLRKYYRQPRPAAWSSKNWAEAAITLFVLFSAIWFALLSIGWPRYAYIALVFSLLIIGKWVWSWFARLTSWRNYRIGLLALTNIALVTNLAPVLQTYGDADAQKMAAYIQTHIPPEAMIETWEWELDAISGHANIHHPDQTYLFQAIRQFSHDRQSFDLDYDLLQADPDYLIAGPFSDWTGIYDPIILSAQFTPVAEIGVYRLYQRNKAGQTLS
jgi:4-amino-4-deoxy-L-arabinose transferase-like glycosyltransferase